MTPAAMDPTHSPRMADPENVTLVVLPRSMNQALCRPARRVSCWELAP
jgi:hypothetical protein